MAASYSFVAHAGITRNAPEVLIIPL